MLTIIYRKRAFIFTTRAQAARFIGKTPMTLIRWAEKFNVLDYTNKKTGKEYTIYFNNQLIRKSDEL